MFKKVFIIIGLFTLMGGIAYATNSGGGDIENAFYWWNDDTTFYFSGFNSAGDFYAESSYVFNPQEIPYLRERGWIWDPTHTWRLGWDGPNPTPGPDANHPLNGSCPEPFVHWIELSGWPDNPAADSFWVGHILAHDGDIVHGVDLKTGGKIPPEMSAETHFTELEWDTLYFFFAERLYTRIDISSDGWAAFNAGDIDNSPHGHLPDGAYPNATLAPYWTDLVPKQQGWPATPWKNPSWGAKAAGHPWWDRKNWRWSTFWGDEYTYVHADSGAVLWGLRFYRLHLITADTSYTSNPDPTQSVMAVNLWIPVFVIEWCDVALASNPDYHYRFQLQLLNPCPSDTWAYFVGRLGRPGLKDTTAEPEIAQMYLYQGRILIPQQIFYFYHSRYDASTGTRVFNNAEPPAQWKNNASGTYDLVGLENEDGSKGLAVDPNRLRDCYPLKFDYFKRYYNDLTITIVNPPFHRVLRWTELQPKVLVQNVGRNSCTNAPITLRIDRAGTEVYRDNADVSLTGLGTDRWADPTRVHGAQDEFQFAKIWIPEDIPTEYHMTAEITWGLDENPDNDVFEKDVSVGCEDTLKYHTNNPNLVFGGSNIAVASYIPYGGSQIGFSWVQALACYILQGFPDDCYQDFEMALVEDNIPGYGVAGHPNCFYYKYLTYWGDWWSTTIYPSLDMTSPHHGRSADHDGWFDDKDASIGPPNFTYLNKNMGQRWFNDELYLGDSLAPGCWTRKIAPDLDPARVYPNSFPSANEPDAWMVYWTGLHRNGTSNYGYCPPFYMDVLMLQRGAGGVRVNTPYWDLLAGPVLFNMTLGKNATGSHYDDMKGPHGPLWGMFVNGPYPQAIPFFSIPFLLSPYPDTEPAHPLLETYIRTGTYDATLYEVTKPMMWGEPAYEPGYYFEDHTSVNFECKIANIGRVKLFDKTEHRFRVFVQVTDDEDNVVHSGYVGIDSLATGDSLIKVKPPMWENTGEGGKHYHAVMCVNYAYPGLHGADHCPYNDSTEFDFWVLWTYDIECTAVLSPEDKATIDSGQDMNLQAVFTNVGYRDTTQIPVTVKIYNAGDETPPDSLLYQSGAWIADLNWRGSPSGPPVADTVDFGTFKVPPTTISNNPNTGRFMRIEFRLAEVWSDEDPNNDTKTVYVNKPPWGVDETARLPKVFSLSQVLPNPIASSAVIKYDVPYTSRVSLRVYDISGKLVKTLVDGKVEAGYREVFWNGTDNAGRRVARGVYFIRMNAPEYTGTRKLVLLR